MRFNLLEDKRNALLSKAQNVKEDDIPNLSGYYAKSNRQYGKNRYERRLKSKVAASVKHFNSIDMDKLFKQDVLDVNIDVTGETNNYIVRISFSSVLDELQRQLQPDKEVSLKYIYRALANAINNSEVYFSCSCPDFKYRGAYWATSNDIIVGTPETRPSDITNPKDKKGPGCKHILLVLSNISWLMKVASVIFNYINYMKDHDPRLYEKYIFPEVYGRDYQLEMDLPEIDDEPRELPIDIEEFQQLVDDDLAQVGKVTNETRDLIDVAGLSLRKIGNKYRVEYNKINTGKETISDSNQAALDRFINGKFRKVSKPKINIDNSSDELEGQTSLEDFD